MKRKSTIEETNMLKKKKKNRQLETVDEALLKTEDEFADRAEDSRHINWIAKSNSSIRGLESYPGNRILVKDSDLVARLGS